MRGRFDEALALLDQPCQHEAADLLAELLSESLTGDITTIAGPAFVMLARATADHQASWSLGARQGERPLRA